MNISGLSADVGIGRFLACYGRARAVAGEQLSVVGKGKDFGAQGGHELCVIAAGKVSAAYGAAEYRVACKGEAAFGAVQDYAAGRMAGHTDDAEMAVAVERHRVAVADGHVDDDGRRLGVKRHPEHARLLRHGVAKGLLGKVGGKRHTVAAAHPVGAYAVVDVQMRIDYLTDFQMIVRDESVEELLLGRGDHAGVDHERVKRVRVIEEIGVLTEVIECENSDFQHIA